MNDEQIKQMREWFEFRIDHLKERHLNGEENAYLRLTEVEMMRDQFERILKNWI